MKHYWWKILAVLLLLYVIVVGLGTPLSPGVLNVDPVTLEKGHNSRIEVRTYNTELTEGKPPHVWIESGKVQICGENVEVVDRNTLKMDLFIPEKLPKKAIHLYLSHKPSGTFLLTQAFFTQGVEKGKPGTTYGCKAVVHEEPEGITFPYRKILYESIRNLYFHVPMWFGMMGLMFFSVVSSIGYLNRFDPFRDIRANEFVKVGLFLGILGIATGSVWARFTWGAWWVNDTKLNGAAITTLIYLAYLILRNSIQEEQTRAKVAAVYNIFAFTMLFVFLWILPRMTDSLHPGSGGNPAFSKYDLDSTMRMVFYPAVLGWFLIGFWIADLRIRIRKIRFKFEEKEREE